MQFIFNAAHTQCVLMWSFQSIISAILTGFYMAKSSIHRVVAEIHSISSSSSTTKHYIAFHVRAAQWRRACLYIYKYVCIVSHSPNMRLGPIFKLIQKSLWHQAFTQYSAPDFSPSIYCCKASPYILYH